MKKDIEWLKKRLNDYENGTIEELWTSAENEYLTARLHGALSLLKEVKQRIDQLDEPEANSQIDKLANFIMSEVEGEPSQNQGAVDTAIRIIKSYQNQETLSQEWIEEHSETFKEIEESMVPLDKQYIKKNKVQEILVPTLSEMGTVEITEEPETVADVIADFFKSLEQLKEVMSMEVEEMEE